MRSMILALGAFAVIGCGDKDDEDSGSDDAGGGYTDVCTDDNACCDYVNAILGCYDRVGYDTSQAGIDETTCTGYAAEADPYFECLADEWNNSTCASAEDITDAATSAATVCVAG